MQINLVFDSSVASAPAGFKTAIEDAADFFSTLFSNPITVTLDIGWGEVDGQALAGNALGESETNYQGPYTYSQVRAGLLATDTGSYDATAVASLSASSPVSNSAQFIVSDAEAKALNLGSQTPDAVDGWVGFSSTLPFAYDPASRAVSGAYDLIGVAEHEITEDLGRVSDLNTFDGTRGAPAYTPFDLFRYAGSGKRQLTTGAPSYFSANGGATDLGDFNNFQTGDSGDLGDWASSVGNDSFLDESNAGVENPVTPRDIQLMEVLGYQLSSTPTVIAGQTFEIAAGETISGLNVLTGGILLIDVNGTAANATVSGTENDSGTASKTLIASGATENVMSGGTASGSTIQAGGRQSVHAGGTASNTAFSGNGGVLTIAANAIMSGTVSNFVPGDIIDFVGISANGVSYSGDTLTLTANGTTVATLAVTTAGAGHFTLASDGGGGSNVGFAANPPQVFLANGGNTDTGYWMFNAGGNIVGFQDLGYPNPAYDSIAVGNFDGAGTEILGRNPQTNDVGYWTTANGAVTGFHDIGMMGNAYSLIGVGDFDASGHDEVLWQNRSTGDTGYWTTSGGSLTGFHDFGQNASTSYAIVGVGDFDASGHDEVLFENRATGDTGYWTTNPSGQITGFHDLGLGSTAYTIAGIGDFDAIGHAEVLWQNASTGDTGYWTTGAAGQVTGFHDLGKAATGYGVIATGDFDGAGHDEVLLENRSTGDVGYWTTNAAGQITGFHDLGAANTAYHIISNFVG